MYCTRGYFQSHGFQRTLATTVVIQVGPDTVAGKEHWNVARLAPHSNTVDLARLASVIRTNINTTQKSQFKVRQVSSC